MPVCIMQWFPGQGGESLLSIENTRDEFGNTLSLMETQHVYSALESNIYMHGCLLLRATEGDLHGQKEVFDGLDDALQEPGLNSISLSGESPIWPHQGRCYSPSQKEKVQPGWPTPSPDGHKKFLIRNCGCGRAIVRVRLTWGIATFLEIVQCAGAQSNSDLTKSRTCTLRINQTTRAPATSLLPRD